MLTVRYETWYCVHGPYHVATNLGVNAKRFMYDVNEDGFSDVVLWYPEQGIWTLARNRNGTGAFDHEVILDDSSFCRTISAFFTNVGRISSQSSPHLLCIAPNGTVFAKSLVAPQSWSVWGQGVGPTPQLPIGLADANGDGLQDLIIPSATRVLVATSSGASFSTPRDWLDMDLATVTAIAYGDVNGDGLSDIGMKAKQCVLVALSASQAFSRPTSWVCSPSLPSDSLMLYPTQAGSATCDLISYTGGGVWQRALSTGAAFGPVVEWVVEHGLACDHGKCGQGEESQEQFVASVFRNTLASPVAVWARGLWAALPPQYPAPNLYNTWEGWYENL
jgi:hypothetical protein